MPRGKKIKPVVEVPPPLPQASVNTPEAESITPPIEAVVGQGMESRAAAVALQQHLDALITATVATGTADDTYLNDEGYDSMSDYWNPPPPTARQVCSSSETFLEGELQSIGTIPVTIRADGQPDADGWYTTQPRSAPPAAAGGAAAAAVLQAGTQSLNFPTTVTLSPEVLEPRVELNRSQSDSPTPTPLLHLTSDNTTVPPKSVKKRPAPNLPEEKKRKRQKKVKGSDINVNDMSSYNCLPLTAGSWPAKVNLPPPTPERVFYPQNASNSQTEVYVHPNYTGVGVVQYVGAAYEKRLNMSVPVFKKLYQLSSTVLEKWSEIEKDGENGLTSTRNSFRADLDSVGYLQVLVTLYKGRPKIHIGTTSYITEILAGSVGSQRHLRTSEHCGQTLSIHVMRDIAERVGRVVSDYTFHPAVGSL